MKDPATGGTEPFDHPEPEELAAFIDGYLSEDRCARIRRHLGRCEDCYEIFMETVRFQEEQEEDIAEPSEGNVLPFITERSSGTLRWATAAAAVVAAIVLGPTLYHSLIAPPEIPAKIPAAQLTVATLVESLPKNLALETWPLDTPRGRASALPESEFAFRSGVETVNVPASLHSSEMRKASRAARRIKTLLGNEGGVDGELTAFYAGITDDTSLSPELEREAAKMADEFLTRVPSLDHFFFEFGQWTEAGYLAAKAHQGDLFARPEVRDYLHWIRKAKREQLVADEVDESLSTIEGLIDRQRLSPKDFKTLQSSFEGILKVYYNPAEGA